ncbi:MAG: transcription elongation factor Spt5 [Nanoarchaeota archaeon]|nr:transcription elongation factor Spt5 [Nanoarchaeota archaeon]
MATGYDDEFDYLEDDSSNTTEDLFVPKIKGAKKQLGDLNEESAEESTNENIPDSDNHLEKQKEQPEVEKPKREFESLIFVVKVTTNKEDKALEMIADKVKKKKIGIYALTRPHGLRGYVFLESPDREHAEEAVFNLPYVKGIIGKTVTYEEIQQMLEPIAADVKIEKNDIIEIISEPFKKEKAKVVRIDKGKGECVVSLLSAVVPIPVTVKLDNIRVIRREELEEE